jgi:hypothetical protein
MTEGRIMKIVAVNDIHAGGRAQMFKRLGVLSFAFFLVKGLVWLGAAAAVAWFGFGG